MTSETYQLTRSVSELIQEFETFQKQEEFDTFLKNAIVALDNFQKTEKPNKTIWRDTGTNGWPCQCCEPLGKNCLCCEPGMLPEERDQTLRRKSRIGRIQKWILAWKGRRARKHKKETVKSERK